MGCLITLAGLIAPRVVLAVLWIFTGWFNNMFDNYFLPILGFVLLPYSLLWYSAVMNWYGGEWGFLQIVVMIVAVLTDLGANKESVTKK